ncbi:MAG: phosphopantetheine-binding protein [Ardenticatenaceae bacterium]|nr:phosphopantetheine-binding protein [Ardenticatenaceae bacterium]
MRTPTQTERTLQGIVAAKLRVDPDQVPLDQPLLEDMGLDSFVIVEIMMEIDIVFAPITVSDRPLETLRTLRDVAAYIDAETRQE